MHNNGFNCTVVLFGNTHQALLGEQALKDSRVEHAVINAPREFKADCGIALRLAPELAEPAKKALERAGVTYESVQPYHCKWI